FHSFCCWFRWESQSPKAERQSKPNMRSDRKLSMTKARYHVATLLMIAAIAFAGTGCSNKDRENGYLLRANRDFEAQQYQEAEMNVGICSWFITQVTTEGH